VSRRLTKARRAEIEALGRRALAALAAHGGWMTFPALYAAVGSPDAGEALAFLPDGLTETRPTVRADGLADAEVRNTDKGRAWLAGVKS
jgi:hypothetical protein